MKNVGSALLAISGESRNSENDLICAHSPILNLGIRRTIYT